jgi:hypothetical protein
MEMPEKSISNRYGNLHSGSTIHVVYSLVNADQKRHLKDQADVDFVVP